MDWYYKLPFSVMKLSGNVERFVQGVCTNTPEAARNAFIDVYGKIVVVFYQRLVAGELYIAFNKDYSAALQQHLKTYLALGKMNMEETGLKAFFVVGMGVEEFDGIKIHEKNSVVLLADNPPQGLREMNENEFDCWRLENDISMQGKEFGHEMIMNTDWSDVVSFTKGCFLGQEIVAKVTQRGKPPKRLVRIAFEKEPRNVRRDGTVIGEVRSKCFSQKLGKWVAYCSIPNDGIGVDSGEIIS